MGNQITVTSRSAKEGLDASINFAEIDFGAI